jgi:DNA-directed RNA polymerase specialized sigma24 family protein
MAYFGRRCAEPQVVADLTSDTFVRAAGAFASFDRSRGLARAWVFGIAANVFARHCEQAENSGWSDARAERLAGPRLAQGKLGTHRA